MSAPPEEFMLFFKKPYQFFMWAHGVNDDGRKWHRYNLATTSAFGINLHVDILEEVKYILLSKPEFIDSPW